MRKIPLPVFLVVLAACAGVRHELPAPPRVAASTATATRAGHESSAAGAPVAPAVVRGGEREVPRLDAGASEAPLVWLPPASIVVPGAFVPQDAMTKYGPSAGESVLDLNGFVLANNDLENDTTNTTLNLGVGVGVFLNQVMELGVRGSGSFSIPEQGSNTITLFGSIDLNFNFRLSRRFWVYIGPHVGFTYLELPGSGAGSSSSSATEPSGGGQLGVRLWLTPSVSLTAEERLTYSEFEFGNTTQERLDSLFRIGFTYVF